MPRRRRSRSGRATNWNDLPKAALANTFDQYWDRFVQRRDDPSFDWVDYTPYELRAIGSFVLLGQPERAQQALEFFMNDRRPPGWNQWPEVVHRDPRTAKFIGDLPHTWCGSDFVNSVRMMFLYEREADDAARAACRGAARLGLRAAHRFSKHADLWRPPDLHFVAVRRSTKTSCWLTSKGAAPFRRASCGFRCRPAGQPARRSTAPRPKSTPTAASWWMCCRPTSK